MRRQKRKVVLFATALILSAGILVGCGATNVKEEENFMGNDVTVQNGTNQPEVAPTNTPTPTEVPTPTPIPTNTPTPTPTPVLVGDPFFDTWTNLDKKLGEQYWPTIENSFISSGNSYRLNRVLDRAKAGEEITVAFIGGSVTEGAMATEKTPKGYQKGYAYLTYEYLCDTYGTGENIKVVTSGVSGTGSLLGVVRADKDILDYQPDLIFVEFAVNNDGSARDKQSFESILRKFLSAENEPAVVLIFSDATYAGGTQVYMQSMGYYYELPMMSMHDSLGKAKQTGKFKWEDYSKDYAHPTQDGHRLYAKSICYLINQSYADKSYDSYTVPAEPSAEGNDKFVNAQILDNTDAAGMIESTGAFVAKDTRFSSTNNSDTTALHKGWVREAGSGNEDFVVRTECKNFLIVLKQTNGTEASVDVYVDGNFVTKINTSQQGGWNNAVTELIIDEETAGVHEIRIRATEGSEDKQQTILAMCYSK